MAFLHTKHWWNKKKEVQKKEILVPVTHHQNKIHDMEYGRSKCSRQSIMVPVWNIKAFGGLYSWGWKVHKSTCTQTHTHKHRLHHARSLWKVRITGLVDVVGRKVWKNGRETCRYTHTHTHAGQDVFSKYAACFCTGEGCLRWWNTFVVFKCTFTISWLFKSVYCVKYV